MTNEIILNCLVIVVAVAVLWYVIQDIKEGDF